MSVENNISCIKDGHSHCYTRFIIASELQGADYRSIFKLCIDPTSSIYNKKKAVCPSFQEPTQLSYKMHKNHEPLKFSELLLKRVCAWKREWDVDKSLHRPKLSSCGCESGEILNLGITDYHLMTSFFVSSTHMQYLPSATWRYLLATSQKITPEVFRCCPLCSLINPPSLFGF